MHDATEFAPATSSEIAAAEADSRPIRRWMQRRRAWVSTHPRFELGYRIGVGILGGAVVFAGMLMLALPGPGWLTVFLGLAILGIEFHWARRISVWLKRQLNRFWSWWRARRAHRTAATTLR